MIETELHSKCKYLDNMMLFFHPGDFKHVAPVHCFVPWNFGLIRTNVLLFVYNLIKPIRTYLDTTSVYYSVGCQISLAYITKVICRAQKWDSTVQDSKVMSV